MRRSGSFGMGYAGIMVLLTSLLVVVYYTQFLHREIFAERAQTGTSFFADIVTQVTQQLPLMTLKEGELETANPVATTIYLSGEIFGERFDDIAIATIDTTGMTTHATMPTPILITRKDIIYQSDRKKEIKSIAEFTADEPPLVINRAVADDIGKKMIAWMDDNLLSIYFVFGGIAYVFIAMFMFFMRMVMLLLLGLGGLAYAALMKRTLSYANAVGVASLSYTPVLLLDTLLFIVRGDSPSSLVLYLAGFVTLIVALNVSEDDTPPQRAS